MHEFKNCFNCVHHYNVDGSTCQCRLQPSYKNTHFAFDYCSDWTDNNSQEEETINDTLDKGHGEPCTGKKAPDTTDWVALKHQYVGMAIQGLLAGNNTEYGSVIDAAIHFAELAVKKLKEKT